LKLWASSSPERKDFHQNLQDEANPKVALNCF